MWGWIDKIPNKSFANRDDWLDYRRTGIGASEIPIIMGVASWSSPLKLWGEKTGRIKRTTETPERLKWGSILEGPIAEEYARRTGRRILDPGDYTVQYIPGTPWFATIDRYQLINGQPGIAEIKNYHSASKKEWQDEPPLSIQLQVQWQLMVTGLQHATVVCLLGGQELVWLDVESDSRTHAILNNTAVEFWDCIKNDTPPEPDGREETGKALQEIYPDAVDELVMLPDEAADLHAEREQVAVQLKQLGDRKTEIDNKLKMYIGNHTAGQIPGTNVQYTWKWVNRKGYVVAPSSSRVLRVKESK